MSASLIHFSPKITEEKFILKRLTREKNYIRKLENTICSFRPVNHYSQVGTRNPFSEESKSINQRTLVLPPLPQKGTKSLSHCVTLKEKKIHSFRLKKKCNLYSLSFPYPNKKVFSSKNRAK